MDNSKESDRFTREYLQGWKFRLCAGQFDRSKGVFLSSTILIGSVENKKVGDKVGRFQRLAKTGRRETHFHAWGNFSRFRRVKTPSRPTRNQIFVQFGGMINCVGRDMEYRELYRIRNVDVTSGGNNQSEGMYN